MSTTSDPQPGWYPDPAAPTWSLRYWDGSNWTDKTTPRPTSDTGIDTGGGAAAHRPAPATGGDADGASGVPGPEAPEPENWAHERGTAGMAWGYAEPEEPVAPGRTARPAASPVPYAPRPVTASSVGLVPGAVFAGLPSSGRDWSSGPSGTGAPARARRIAHTGWWRAIGVTLGALLVGTAVYFSYPKSTDSRGTQWFASGVPGWADLTVSGLPTQDGAVLHSWAVPGPRFAGVRPFLTVVNTGDDPYHDRPGLTSGAGSFLINKLMVERESYPAAQGQLVKLSDGSPGLLWSTPARLESAPQVPLVNFSLYAFYGRHLYWVLFETTTAAFRAERAGVQKVMLSFKGASL